MNFNPFEKKNINYKPLVLDGAMGSLLQQMGGFKRDKNIWMTNLLFDDSDLIIDVHRKYLEAGADIITTNTFRTNPYSLELSGISDPDIYVKQALCLAKDAIGNKTNILIAGSNAPAEECYQRERTISKQILEVNHKKHIDLLIDNDVDFILNETQSHLDEIKIISEHCSKNKIAFVVSLYFDSNLKILSGESIKETIELILSYNPLAIGFNCIAPDLYRRLLGSIELDFTWGYYLNCMPTPMRSFKFAQASDPVKTEDRTIECVISPVTYIQIVKESFKYKPSFIGSCCGSSPDHIQKIRELIDGKDKN